MKRGCGSSDLRSPIMDKPVTPAEQFADAVTSLVMSLDKLREALEILACEMIIAEGQHPPAAARWPRACINRSPDGPGGRADASR
jgi:hypothetical protein